MTLLLKFFADEWVDHSALRTCPQEVDSFNTFLFPVNISVPETPTTVKIQAATAAKTVAGREKWVRVTSSRDRDGETSSKDRDGVTGSRNRVGVTGSRSSISHQAPLRYRTNIGLTQLFV